MRCKFEMSSICACILTENQANCITDNVNLQTQCGVTDDACLCADKTLGYDIGYCIGLNCDAADVELTLEFTENYCASTMSLCLRNEIQSTNISVGIASSGSAAKTTDALFSAITAEATATGAGGTVATVTASSSSNNSPNRKSSSSKGLSTAAKIGIAVGVPVGVLAAAGATLLAYCLGRRKKDASTDKDASEEASTSQMDAKPPGSAEASTAPEVVPQPPMTETYIPPPQQPPESVSPVVSNVPTPQPSVVQPHYPQPQFPQPQYPQAPVYNVAGVPPASPSPNIAYATPAYAPPAAGVPSGSPSPNMAYATPAYAPPAAGVPSGSPSPGVAYATPAYAPPAAGVPSASPSPGVAYATPAYAPPAAGVPSASPSPGVAYATPAYAPPAAGAPPGTPSPNVAHATPAYAPPMVGTEGQASV